MCYRIRHSIQFAALILTLLFAHAQGENKYYRKEFLSDLSPAALDPLSGGFIDCSSNDCSVNPIVATLSLPCTSLVFEQLVEK